MLFRRALASDKKVVLQLQVDGLKAVNQVRIKSRTRTKTGNENIGTVTSKTDIPFINQ
jgi:hypothetical protein